MEDILSQMFGGGMGGMGGAQRQRSALTTSKRGQNATAWIDLTADEASEEVHSTSYTQLIQNSRKYRQKASNLKINVKPKSKHGTEVRIKDQGHGHPQGLTAT